MRLIIPIILIALMLPYATGEDEPSGEWLIAPDPTMGVATSAASRGGDGGDGDDSDDSDDANACVRRASTQPTTQPAPSSVSRRTQRL